MKGLISIITALAMVFSPSSPVVYASLGVTEFRAAWVASVANLDFPTKRMYTTPEMKKEIDAIVNRAAEVGLNAIVLQVRPCGDALYKSDIFPWSEYLMGVQGLAPYDDFDPLLYWIEQAHAKDIELHAWINPYRVSNQSADRTALADNNPVRLNPSWVLAYDNKLFYDPGEPACQELIIKGVAEIVRNYDVDGIHLDDYFYPYPNGTDAFPDGASFKKYGGGLSLDDWRRQNINTLVKDIQAAIKEIKPHVRYGISPFAIWQNKSSHEYGSDTTGFESYKSIYSDSRLWVKEGWLDYICPQIYWTVGYNAADYSKVLNWWRDVCEGTGVDLYVGHAAYREGQNEAGWNGEILRQLEMNKNFADVSGSIFFRMGFLNSALGDTVKGFYNANPITRIAAGWQPSIIMKDLTVSQPSKNVTVASDKGYTILGTAIPDRELYMNNELITNVTPEGFFSVYVPLQKGDNTFTFSQEGEYDITRVITVKAAAPPPPQAAPPKVIDIDPRDKYYAAVTAALAWVYPGATTNTGSAWALEKGQKDLIIAKTDDGKWFKLSSGAWIESANVAASYDKNAPANVLSNGVYERGVDADIIKWDALDYPAANVKYEDKTLTVYLGMQTNAPRLSTGSIDATLLSEVTVGDSYYIFKFKDDAKIEGIYTEYKDNSLRLVIKKRKKLAQGDKPLTGFTFLIDAGHGDTDNGAVGPMGARMSEKVLNLTNSLKLAEELKKYGATVELTRTTDVFHTLHRRAEISYALNPDLYISIHANSMPETTDSSEIKGLTVWYRNPMSLSFAWLMSEKLKNINPNTTRSKVLNVSNFYVCRPVWTPSVIIETSFMCNITDFSWLVSNDAQDEYAKATARAIIDYYEG